MSRTNRYHSLKPLIILPLIFSTLTSPLGAITHSNKTFLTPRSVGANTALQNSIWHRHITNEVGNKYGFTVQAASFYQNSGTQTKIGQYFGANESNIIAIKQNKSSTDRAYFPASSILHNPSAPHPFFANVQLRPAIESYGVHFGLFYDLKSITDGLAFTLHAPIVYVSTNVHSTITGEKLQAGNVSITDYFQGKVIQTQEDKKQEALKYAKFNESHGVTHSSDIKVLLSYTVLEEEDFYLTLRGGVSIPGGNKATGTWLFEPLTGNGDHFGIILGSDAAVRLWKKNKSALEFICNIEYCYLFENEQKRVIGVTNYDGSLLVWPQYRLAGQSGAKGVFPLANVLRQDVDVFLGNQVEAVASLALYHKGGTFTLGVDLYAREGETITVKKWSDNTYGLAREDYDTNEPFSADHLPVDQTFISEQMLNPNAAATPAQMSTKLFATFAYSIEQTSYPILLGICVSYEFAAQNSIPNSASGWATLGFSF